MEWAKTRHQPKEVKCMWLISSSKFIDSLLDTNGISWSISCRLRKDIAETPELTRFQPLTDAIWFYFQFTRQSITSLGSFQWFVRSFSPHTLPTSFIISLRSLSVPYPITSIIIQSLAAEGEVRYEPRSRRLDWHEESDGWTCLASPHLISFHSASLPFGSCRPSLRSAGNDMRCERLRGD